MNIKFKAVFLFAFSLLLNHEVLAQKLLVLIIASDQRPVYIQEQALWRSYMNYDPEHVEVYFLKGDQDLGHAIEIKDDIVWCREGRMVGARIRKHHK